MLAAARSEPDSVYPGGMAWRHAISDNTSGARRRAALSSDLIADWLTRRYGRERGREARLEVVGGVPTSWQYAALWIALACVAGIILLIPDLPVAVYQPRISIAVASVSGVIGLGLLELGLLRFRVLGRPIDLHTGLAFGVLGFSNLFTAWTALPAGRDLSLERAAYFLLLAHAMAAALFLSGLASSRRHQRGRAWTWSGWLGLACAIALGVAATAVLLSRAANLPPVIDASTRNLLGSAATIPDVLPGQQPFLLLANAALAIALQITAIGFTAEGHRLEDAHIAALAAGMIFIFFGQVQTIFFPLLAIEYVTSGDVFRVVGYGLLLSSVMWQTSHDVATNATHHERLRLSRELHDGLAQQLAVLRLRLGRVAETTTSSDHRSHDLEVAQHVLQSASMEARRAIAALRSDRVPWEEFEQALSAFSAEFSLTHDVNARVWMEPSDLRLDGQLHADVLRIVQEAFSNAARHGEAKRIDAAVAPNADGYLWLAVQDDGQGFDLSFVSYGVGLRSIAERVERRGGQLTVDSAPGQGTRIEAWLPLQTRRPESV